MAAGDLTDLMLRVRYRGSFNSADTGLTDTVITAQINAALKQVASEQDWPWLESSATITSANGIQSYAVPTGWVRTTAIIDTAAGVPLDERSVEEIDSFTAVAHPLYFALYGDAVLLGPTPDAVYSLKHRFVKAESVLSAGTDLPLIPRAFDEGVVEFATALCHLFTRQTEKAAEAQARYDAWLKTTQDIVNRTLRPRRAHVAAGTGTLADLSARLLARGGFKPTDVEIGYNARVAFINAAIKKIANERDWPWLYTTATITTVANTSTYALPAAHVRTDSIFEPSTGTLLDERQIEELDALVTTADRPVFFAAYGSNMVLAPPPDGVYTLTHRYVRSETPLAAQTDTPLIPAALDEGIVEWAAKLAFDTLGNAEASKAAAERYDTWIKQTVDNIRRTRRPVRVQVRAGAVW